LSVNFVWKSVNLEAGETLRLEIAVDRNFTRNVQIVENVNNQTQAVFESGLWHWRLCWGKVVLSAGQLTVADATGPKLLSPAMNSLFRYQNDLPQLRFQWSEKIGANHYVFEICETPDFIDPTSKRSSAASYILPGLESGTWYWRVQPVFSSAYEGTAAYSATASFRIEQSSDPAAPAIELPDPEPPPAIAEGEAVAGRNYIVRPGDYLSRIAVQAYGTDSGMAQIIAANNIADANLIFVGQVIFIPLEGEL
jgi:LysM repeat protein